MRTPPLTITTFALLSRLPSALATNTYAYEPTTECPILGPIWPSSTYPLASSQAFAKAKEAFPNTIQSLFHDGYIDPSTATFALDVYSTRTNESLYQYFHTAEGPGGEESLSSGVLDDGTVFRTGSVSKLHTVYAILVAGGKGLSIFDEEVGKYVPELILREEDDEDDEDGDEWRRIRWEEMTIGALVGQQSGVGGPDEASAICGCTATACNVSAAPECVQDFLTYMRTTRHATQPIHQTPQYADAGFLVLTQVLVSMTNMTYDAAIKTYIAEPLGMSVTGSIAREEQEANAVILPGGVAEGSNWGIDNQVLAGSGGIYSNLRDLRLLGLSILNNELLDPKTTKQWLKPSGFVGSSYKAVGAPWEIERLAIPISPHSNRTRISDQFTKGGGQVGYTAVFLLSPDHGLGYSVLVAGPGASQDRWTLRSALGEAFVPAAEWAGYEHAEATLPGTYVDESTEGTNLTLSVRPDRPGVGLDNIFIEGFDYRSNMTSYSEPLPSAALANLSTPMFPTGLATSTGNGCQRIQYRATPNTLPYVFPRTRTAAEGGTGLFDDVCSQPWLTAGFFNLANGAAIDEFVFVFDAEGGLKSMEYPAVGAKFSKAR